MACAAAPIWWSARPQLSVAPIRAGEIAQYADHRPPALLRLSGVTDAGIVLLHGSAVTDDDAYGARDAWVFRAGDTFYMDYDAAGPQGWIANLATSTDLRHWRKAGPMLALGPPGSPDSASASYATTFWDGRLWRAFYLGTPNATPAPERVPQFPYLTLRATSAGPAGPWRKVAGAAPFSAEPGTYYSVTASPGPVLRIARTYLQFFSAAQLEGRTARRTLAIARTTNLDGAWTVDKAPILPSSEQIENASFFYQASTATWFLFTNHVGLLPDGVEYTDAIWMYWTQDLERWNPADKALVLDGASSIWSHTVIGLPSIVEADPGRLALFYDGRRRPAATELAKHMQRDIGLAFIRLPIRVPGSR